METSRSSAACQNGLVHRVAEHLLAVVRVRPQETAAHAKRFARVTQLLGRQFDRLHRQHRDPEQPVGVRLAIIREPAVVGAAHRGGQFGVLDRAGEQTEAWVEERGVDPVEVHVHDAGVGIEAALAPVGVFQAVEPDLALPDADRPQAADAARITQQLAFDGEPFLAVVVDDEPRPAFPERGLDIVVPQRERLENVAVGVDGFIGPCHCLFLPGLDP